MLRRFLPLAVALIAVGGVHLLTVAAQTATTPTAADPDTDGDGLSDYAEAHKYFTDPHKAITAGAKPDGDWDKRKEFTYTITSVMQFAKPYNPADMTDDYQDARVLSEDADSITVEIVYYPLNTNRYAIGENPNWKTDYAHMTQYLRPTPTENWDGKMRADLLAALQKDGIDPDQLSDKQLVTEVSHWLMQRSRTTNSFAIWYVHYPNGVPEVFPSLRKYFDKEKPSPEWTDQAMFDQEVLGRSMFYNQIHGSCTSSATYMATILRALGIPTRMVYCVPPLDANDRQQREMFLSAIHHNRVRATIRHGLQADGGDFANHIFTEVFVGNRWVRLNYDVLGQNNLDDNYFGLLTHALTTDSLTHVPLAETWGRRYATYPAVSPKLSSTNPYQLLKVSDHFGVNSHVANPEVEDEELRKVTVVEAYWNGAIPPAMWQQGFHGNDPTNSDLFIGIREYIPNYRLQLREFSRRAGREFVLSAPGHPDVKAKTSGATVSYGDRMVRHQLFSLRVDPLDKELVEPGVEYSIHPVNTNEIYNWSVKEGLVAKAGSK